MPGSGVGLLRLRRRLPIVGASNQCFQGTAVTPSAQAAARADYQLRFESLYNHGRALEFPCDDAGHVEIDALSERARDNYFYARAVVGREYCAPIIVRWAS